MVGVEGFEPPAPWSQTTCATKLRHTPLPTLLIIAKSKYMSSYFTYFINRGEEAPKLRLSPLIISEYVDFK